MSYEIIEYGDINKGSQDTIDKGILKVVALVCAQTKTLAPSDLGELRNSYMYITSKEEGGFNDGPKKKADKKLSGSAEKNTGYVGSNTKHAPHQEFGTKYMGPQPHLRPAVELVVGGKKVENVLKDIANEQMSHALKRGKKVKKG